VEEGFSEVHLESPAHLTKGYSPNLVEGESSEGRIHGPA
jgi:hypothetical protein